MTAAKVSLVAEAPGLERLINHISDGDAATLLALMVSARTSLHTDVEDAVDRGLQLLPALIRLPVRKVLGR
ncbi:MAG: hypothetical protein WBB05_29315 [Mycolicibacterium fortuitum]|uniref:hypothetical protein n=1 Tax=Mycolicibacterium fortuitum TaxID=1766 RepID=UPI0022BA4E12|nr:hypothetical protein [Mycolicibacterium fortuitum]WAY19777.1 hypothetical protein OF855_01170 [Mycolicibacterium fortuitum]